MSEFIDRQKPVIERSGMGLLPGIAVAFFIAIALIAALLTDNMLVVLIALAGIFVVTGVVLVGVFGLLGSDDDIYSRDGE